MRQNLCWLVMISSAAAFVSTADAADQATGGGQVILLSADESDRFAGGQLSSCEVNYTVAFQDWIYRNGAPVVLRGSVAVTAAGKKGAFISLKATPFDYDGDKLTVAPIDYAYLSVRGVSYSSKEYVKFPCEDGGFCSAYSLFQYPDLSDFTNGFSISFNRKAGGSDVEVPINLLRDKPEAYAAHAKCMVRLLDIIKENLPK